MSLLVCMLSEKLEVLPQTILASGTIVLPSDPAQHLPSNHFSSVSNDVPRSSPSNTKLSNSEGPGRREEESVCVRLLTCSSYHLAQGQKTSGLL